MAETNPTGYGLSDLVRVASPWVVPVSGAVLGMAFGEGLTVKGRILSLAMGLAAAIWLGPALVGTSASLWPWGQFPAEVGTAITFLTGLFGMVLLSGFAQALAKYSRDPFRLVRIQAGPVTIGGSNEGAAK